MQTPLAPLAPRLFFKLALVVVVVPLALPSTIAGAATLDESPATESQWGYRPAAGSVSAVNPPGFSWRPERDVVSWELECRQQGGADNFVYHTDKIEFNVHCPAKVFPAGKYVWRYRGIDKKGQATNWSQPRQFTIPAEAVAMPMPTRQELLSRIPKSHPRLFIRPEDLARMRQLAQGPLADRFQKLLSECDRLLARPPRTEEPRKYPEGMERGSMEWQKIWWGNREYTVAALDSAAKLAFTRLLGGKEAYGQMARRILMDCARWDPKGATGYRYNDEAGMPYSYLFSRTYTFVYDLLSEEERETCRQVMKIRGDEMYKHLCPRHLWEPYASHSNRAWHKLGEVGIAFQGEIEGADDWVWFAMNVFYNVYPVWCDDDGGWHEGSSYWQGYLTKFTWWSDVMRSSFGIDAYKKPFFSKVGYYPMYLMPPGKRGGGFGDLTPDRTSRSNLSLMSIFAAQAQNAYWEWYVRELGGPDEASGYIGFVRGSLPKVEPKAPDDLPASKLFRGIGQAYLNTTLHSAADDVQVVFKSSPFGTQSHGYEANNSFLLFAYGEPLLLNSGRRDSYGSKHHKDWMWSTRSVNNITVEGVGQLSHSAQSKGAITAFQTTPSMDLVVGQAGANYVVKPTQENPDGRLLDRFTRAILFVKPELVIVFDRLEARRPSSFEYWLHAANRFEVKDQQALEVHAGDVACPIRFLAPEGLSFSQTDQYDPNPQPKIKVREWHLTAKTPEKRKTVEFVTLMRPRRSADGAGRASKPVEKESLASDATLKRIDGGYFLTADLSDGHVTALLPTRDTATLSAEGLTTTGQIVVERFSRDGRVVATLKAGNSPVATGP